MSGINKEKVGKKACINKEELVRRNWHVVGLSGVTGGGKTTLARALLDCLPCTTVYISQDQYFLPDHHPAHPKAPAPLTGLNKDTLKSIDMMAMTRDIRNILSADPRRLSLAETSAFTDRRAMIGSALHDPKPKFIGQVRLESDLPGILLLDGFMLFSDPDVPPMCDLLFFFTLTKEQCLTRRKVRVFSSQGVSNDLYFDLCVWPQYLEHYEKVRNTVPGIAFLDGGSHPDVIKECVWKKISCILEG